MNGFFHEPAHLEYLVQSALPELIRSYGYGVGRKLTVWIAGCLRGEEPYTLAMVLSEFSRRYPGIGFDFLILASDASEDVLEAAQRGIYTEEDAQPVPLPFKTKYLMRSKDRSRKLVRIVPELREMVKFRRIPLTEGPLRFRETLDVVFCRDVFRHIDSQSRRILLHRMYPHLSPGGYVFLGDAIDPRDIDVPLVLEAQSVYRKAENVGGTS